MAITLDLKPELEAQLRDEAAKTGIETRVFVVRALEEKLRRRSCLTMPTHLSEEESNLLQKINEGLPEVMWQEYHGLIAKRREETLMPEELARLITITERIEESHVERIVHVAELAQRRQIPLKTMMGQLGIAPRKA